MLISLPLSYLPAVSFLVGFTLDAGKGRYVVETCEPGFTRVPRELIVEDRRYNDEINANIIIRGTATAKKAGGRSMQFFTGLLPTSEPTIYLGNVLTFGHSGERIRNGIVVRFTADAGRMTLRYFPAYYPVPNARASFIAQLVQQGLI